LVRYGKLGFLGCFAAATVYPWGSRVVLQTARGLELGEVLLPDLPTAGPLSTIASEHLHCGDLLRLANTADLDAAHHAQQIATRLLHQFDTQPPPWLVLDVEVTLDLCCILHVLPPADDHDPSSWLADWEARTGFRLRLLDLSQLPPQGAISRSLPTPCSGCSSHTASHGGCSSCGSGCSSGACARRALSADELTAYLALLRQRFQEHNRRHCLL
jgi:hypothetical protein